MSSILAASLIISAPTVVFAHVGHGDEFQATGGINRVKVNPQTNQLLGIVVTPIASSAKSGSAVMIPVTALVDANGKQIVFVQYENFYEPVEVTTGATKGELIAVTKGRFSRTSERHSDDGTHISIGDAAFGDRQWSWK
ncbi:hypothetical protein [Anabaena sp. UHCC 0399]|uniref:hypothetical protein n=1 Tax=Anabaena sp. UHCC 0399 TaxID=3110238 RepID=UPI002B20415D|nr:hypothetical protein [Anabaena sp. UHCC 0399]MEA5565381.1 hypothetical protein [Anabaena sp. UHCC 0399]